MLSIGFCLPFEICSLQANIHDFILVWAAEVCDGGLPYSGGLMSSCVTSKKFKTNSQSDIFDGNLISAYFEK